MTSEGAVRNVPTYGPVSAAKAALESHIRQLAMELIPARHHRQRHPRRRDRHARPAPHPRPRGAATTWPSSATRRVASTRPEDVAEAIVALASPRLYWMTGNTIGVDGGEAVGSRQHGIARHD